MLTTSASFPAAHRAEDPAAGSSTGPKILRQDLPTLAKTRWIFHRAEDPLSGYSARWKIHPVDLPTGPLASVSDRYLISIGIGIGIGIGISSNRVGVSRERAIRFLFFFFLATPVQVSRSRFGDRFPSFGDCFAVPFRVKFLKPSVSFFVFFGPRWRVNMVQKKGTRKRSQMVPIPGARFSRGKITEMELWATSEQRPSRPLLEAGPRWHRTRHLCI